MTRIHLHHLADGEREVYLCPAVESCESEYPHAREGQPLQNLLLGEILSGRHMVSVHGGTKVEWQFQPFNTTKKYPVHLGGYSRAFMDARNYAQEVENKS